MAENVSSDYEYDSDEEAMDLDNNFIMAMPNFKVEPKVEPMLKEAIEESIEVINQNLSKINREESLTEESLYNATLEIYIEMLKGSQMDYYDQKHFLQELADAFMEQGGISLYLTSIYSLHSALREEGFEDEKSLIKLALDSLVDFSESSEKFAIALCSSDDFFILVEKFLTKFDTTEYDQLEENVRSSIETVLIIVKNCLIHDDSNCVFLMRHNQIIEVVKPYLQSTLWDTKRYALLICAYVAREEDADIFKAELETIVFLIQYLSTAVESKDYRADDLSSSIELAKGIERLSQNEDNKVLLVEQGIVPVLKLMTESDMPQERFYAFSIIESLAFNNDTKEKIWQDTSLFEALETPCQPTSFKRNPHMTDEQFQNCILNIENTRQNALWTLEQNDTDKDEISETQIGEKIGHIMISYSHSDKEIARKIENDLSKKGYLTWIDYKHIKGNPLDAMAEAVENASVLIAVISSNYKISNNGRREIQYADAKSIPLIFIRAERAYRPDRWLGLLLGGDNRIDFSGKYKFEAKFKELEESITDKLTKSYQLSTKPSSLKKLTSTASRTTSEDPNYVHWSASDVKEWLANNEIKQKSNESLDGRALEHLKALLKRNRKLFDQEMQEHFGLSFRGTFEKILNGL